MHIGCPVLVEGKDGNLNRGHITKVNLEEKTAKVMLVRRYTLIYSMD